MAAVRAGVHSVARSRSGSDADRVALDVVAVLQAVAEDHVHHAQGQRGVGAGQEGQVLVRLLGGARAEGIDGHQLRARAAAPPR